MPQSPFKSDFFLNFVLNSESFKEKTFNQSCSFSLNKTIVCVLNFSNWEHYINSVSSPLTFLYHPCSDKN